MTTKERILDSALVEFALKGYEGATIRSIAKRAGVNLAMISYYFGGKEGLYRSVLERHLDEFIDALKNIPEDELEAIRYFVSKHVDVLRKRGALMSVLVMREMVFQTSTFKELKKTFYKVIVEKLSTLVKRAMDKGYIRPMDVEFVVFYLMHIDFWFTFKFSDVPDNVLVDKIMEIFLRGVGA